MIDIEAWQLIDLVPTHTVTIKHRTETIAEWESRCEHYSTTIHFCKCKGFNWYKWCTHQGYQLWKRGFLDRELKQKKSNFFESQIQPIFNFWFCFVS